MTGCQRSSGLLLKHCPKKRRQTWKSMKNSLLIGEPTSAKMSPWEQGLVGSCKLKRMCWTKSCRVVGTWMERPQQTSWKHIRELFKSCISGACMEYTSGSTTLQSFLPWQYFRRMWWANWFLFSSISESGKLCLFNSDKMDSNCTFNGIGSFTARACHSERVTLGGHIPPAPTHTFIVCMAPWRSKEWKSPLSETLPDTPSDRKAVRVASAVSMEGSVYVATKLMTTYQGVGLMCQEDAASVWKYHPGFTQWKRVYVLNKFGSVALAASPNRMFVIGGHCPWPSHYPNTIGNFVPDRTPNQIYELDLVNEELNSIGHFRLPRHYMAVTVLDDDWLYAIGGSVGITIPGNKPGNKPVGLVDVPWVEAFNLQTLELKGQQDMMQGRSWPSCATAKGTIFVSSWPARTVEFFTIHSGKWTKLAEVLSVPRFGAAMVLSHGQLLMFGGFTWSNNSKRYEALEDVEVLPSTNAVNESSLKAWRKQFHGNLLSERKAWVAAVKTTASHHMDRVFLIGGVRKCGRQFSDPEIASQRVEVWSIPNLAGIWLQQLEHVELQLSVSSKLKLRSSFNPLLFAVLEWPKRQTKRAFADSLYRDFAGRFLLFLVATSTAPIFSAAHRPGTKASGEVNRGTVKAFSPGQGDEDGQEVGRIVPPERIANNRNLWII